MPRHIVVDGYNLLFTIGRSPREADRTYLLNLLASYKSRKSVDITVVFDRKTGNPAEGKQFLGHQGVRIIFTAPGQEADEIIREIVEASKNPKNTLVVSSDKAGITKYCRKIGAEVAYSADFFSFLTHGREAAGHGGRGDNEESEEKPDVQREDIDYYLEKFGKKKK